MPLRARPTPPSAWPSTALGNEISIAYPGASASSHSVGSSHSLTGVSCNSAFSSCTAVDDHGQEVTFAPGTGGGTPIAVDGTNPVPLTAVSCASDYSQCTAVDQTGNETTFAPGAGGSPQSVDGITLLSDVSCPAGTDTQCTAVDNQGNEVTFNPSLRERTGPHTPWSPTSWPPLSCPTATQCTAVEAGRAGDHLRSHHAKRHRAGRQRQHRPVPDRHHRQPPGQRLLSHRHRMHRGRPGRVQDDVQPADRAPERRGDLEYRQRPVTPGRFLPDCRPVHGRRHARGRGDLRPGRPGSEGVNPSSPNVIDQRTRQPPRGGRLHQPAPMRGRRPRGQRDHLRSHNG